MPESAALTPLIPSQQSSLSGTRTTLVFHALMAATPVALTSPSKMPPPVTHEYSVPARSTPWSTTVWSLLSTILLPLTWRAGRSGAAPLDELPELAALLGPEAVEDELALPPVPPFVDSPVSPEPQAARRKEAPRMPEP